MLFPDAVWCVDEQDEAKYRVKNVLIHPKDIIGIAKKRNWILQHPSLDERIILIDDDVTALWVNVGSIGHRIQEPQAIQQIIDNAAEVSAGIGAPIFGFSQAWDVRKFSPMNPFAVTGWVSTAIGFVGRLAEYDDTLRAQADIDTCLRALLRQRVIWIDRRFAFVCKRFTNSGGSAGVRTRESYEADLERILQKWAPWLVKRKAKTTIRLEVHVPRRQHLDHLSSEESA